MDFKSVYFRVVRGEFLYSFTTDCTEITDEVGSGKMPLKSYLLIHRDSKQNSEEISA